MSENKITIDITQEEYELIYKRRQREQRARVKSKETLVEYLKTLPTVNVFLKKTGLSGEPQTRRNCTKHFVLQELNYDVPNPPLALTEAFSLGKNILTLDVDQIEITTKSLCGIKFLNDVHIIITAYKNKVFYMHACEEFRIRPIQYFSGRFYISSNFKEEIIERIYHNYCSSILAAEAKVREYKKYYEDSQQDIKELKKIFGKNYDKYKNMFNK